MVLLWAEFCLLFSLHTPFWSRSSKSAHESGLCRRLITVVYGEPFLSQVTHGDHIQHPGFSLDSHTSASGLKVADYKTIPERNGRNRLPTTKENTAPETSSCISYIRAAQLLSRVWLCDPMNCSMPGFPVFPCLPELAQTHVHQIDDAIQPSHPLSSPSPPLPSVFPSIRVFSNESALHIRWPKYWSSSLTP